MTKPYYQDNLVTLYHGDSRDFIAEAEGRVVITDPPYANETGYDGYADTEANLLDLISCLVSPMIDVAKRTAITPGVRNAFLYPRPKWILCWTSEAGVGSGPWGFCCWQPVLVYGKDPFLQAGLGRRPDLLTGSESSPKNGHPCPKPVQIWQRIMQRISVDQDEEFFDPFGGGGTTLVAAKQLGRRAVAIEQSEKYCEIAVASLAQGSIFEVA